MIVELLNNEVDQRYEAIVDGELASLVDYRQIGEVLDFPHTETRPAFGRQGLASKVVRFALDDVRNRGSLIRPSCPFVAEFIEANPEYRSLVAE